MAVANKNRAQRLIDGLSHVDCIDLVVRKGTLVPEVEEIATSWRRCLTAHHLDLEIQAAPHIITQKEIKDSREPLRNLILHAQEELDRLYAIVGPQEYVVLLCDRDGVAIHHRGDESLADAYKDCGIWLVLMNNAMVERPQYPWRYANRTEPELRNCSAYACERITRKRADTNASETMW